MSYSMKGGAWAQPTQASINKTYKNTKVFGMPTTPMKNVKNVKSAPKKKSSSKKFDPAKFDRMKKKVFGMYY